jgi:hypothetical protein
MKSLVPSPTPDLQRPLEGEVLPPDVAYAAFLESHGRKPPRPKAYRSFKSAIAAIVRDAARYSP